MAKHLWSILCRRGILDTYSNAVSLIDVIEGFDFSVGELIDEGKQWRALPMEAAIVSTFERSDPDKPETTSYRVQIRAPNGQIFPNHTESELNLMGSKRIRQFTVIQHIPFLTSGTYQFVISLRMESGDWHTVAEVSLDIKQKELSS